jgi:hypothetical protein
MDHGPIQGKVSTDEIRAKMQKGYFNIGINNEVSSETSYGQGISNTGNNLGSFGKGPSNRTHLKASIMFGNQGTDYKSEAKSQFLGEKNQNQQPNSVALEKNRAQHFKLSDAN